MEDLISRQSAIEIIQNLYPGMPRVPWLRKDWQERYEPYIRTEKAIKGLPSAQPEQKKGRWIKTYRNGFGNLIGYCNQCGRSASVDNYCPNCGADMRGEVNG